MNYEFWFDGQPHGKDDLPIGYVFREEWQRPTIGGQVRIKGRNYKITRTSPAGNPTGQKVIYYVEPVNDNWPYRARK
jgi:hypothetical protein